MNGVCARATTLRSRQTPNSGMACLHMVWTRCAMSATLIFHSVRNILQLEIVPEHPSSLHLHHLHLHLHRRRRQPQQHVQTSKFSLQQQHLTLSISSPTSRLDDVAHAVTLSHQHQINLLTLNLSMASSGHSIGPLVLPIP